MPLGLAAQSTGRGVGRVLDAGTGKGIAGAVVEVVGAAVRATSQIDGRFTLTSVPAGPVALRARMIGSTSKVVRDVLIAAGTTVTIDITLTAETIQLEELTVTAEAERGSGVSVEGENRVWGPCAVARRQKNGSLVMERLFGPILERRGRFQFVSCANKLD